MAKVAIEFNEDLVAKALLAMGIPQKDIDNRSKLLRFLDDAEKCRVFCGHLQGVDAIKRQDPTFMERYQARAERLVRTFARLPIPKDLNQEKERYVDMAKSAAKTKPAANQATGKTKPAAKKLVVVANESDPKWFSKFARRGIAFRMAVLLHRKAGEVIPGETKVSKIAGATKAELIEDLVSSFSDHAPSSLANNVNVEISSLQKRLGKKLVRQDDAKRGTVYSFA